MEELADESINIVVTSPPYPMVEMWDDIFAMQNKAIACNIADNPSVSFDLMHGILNNIWMECYRVLSEGSIKKLIGRELTWSDDAVELKKE